jgi:hypothetical protein
MRLLVCGGRGYGVMPDGYPLDQTRYWLERSSREAFFVNETLDCLHAKEPISVLIHGGAKGADSLAGAWAVRKGISVQVFKADWRKGRGGGPIRNKRMLTEGRPDRVVAFPGHDGTANMVAQARAAGVPVFEAGV